MDQHPLPRTQATVGDQGVVHGRQSNRKGTSLLEREGVRDSHEVSGGHNCFGGEPGPAPHDPLPKDPALDLRSDPDDLASQFPTGTRARCTIAVQQIGAIEPGGPDPDPHLARSQRIPAHRRSP